MCLSLTFQLSFFLRFNEIIVVYKLGIPTTILKISGTYLVNISELLWGSFLRQSEKLWHAYFILHFKFNIYLFRPWADDWDKFQKKYLDPRIRFITQSEEKIMKSTTTLVNHLTDWSKSTTLFHKCKLWNGLMKYLFNKEFCVGKWILKNSNFH